MKRIRILILALIVTAALMCSCNRYVCPAYASNADTEETENNPN
jgi:hypothetical protein